MKRKIILLVSVIAILVFALSMSQLPAQSPQNKYVVKLYSGEKVIAQWVSTSLGTVEGTSLVFTSSQGYDETKLQVRISGHYTVEQIVQ